MSTPTADAEIEAVLAQGFPFTRFQGFWLAVGPAGPVAIESDPGATAAPAMRLREALQTHVRVLSAPVDAGSVTSVLMVPGPLVPDTAGALHQQCVGVLSAPAPAPASAPEPAPVAPASMFHTSTPVPAPSPVPGPASAEASPPAAAGAKPRTPMWLWAARVLAVVLVVAVAASWVFG